jgi:hypothetical protein
VRARGIPRPAHLGDLLAPADDVALMDEGHMITLPSMAAKMLVPMGAVRSTPLWRLR